MTKNVAPDTRPKLVDVTSAEALNRWYWTRAELVAIAQNNGISTQGTKAVLLQRIVATIGEHAHEPVPVGSRHGATEQSSPKERLSPPFTRSMIIPSGQPFTRELRSWLGHEIGREVKVNQAMRDLMRNPKKGTLEDLIALAIAPPVRSEIPPQFELNRLMRVLAEKYPHMSQSERKRAWQDFRNLPASERAEILGGEVIAGNSE